MRFIGFRPSTELSFVACKIGLSTYALPISRVREIIQPLPVTPLPEAPFGILGAVDHRGEVLPLIDLGLLLSAGPTEDRKRKWILLASGKSTVGLVVRQVFEVFRVAETEVRKAPDVGGNAGYSTLEVVNFRGQMAFILDVSKVCALAHPGGEEGAVSKR